MIGHLSPRCTLLASTGLVLIGLTQATPAAAGPIRYFSPGDLVISTVSSLNGGGLDSAAPIVLEQFKLGAGGNLPLPPVHSPCRRPPAARTRQYPASTDRRRRARCSVRWTATR